MIPGAQDFVDIEGNRETGAWTSLEARAKRTGPWDAVLACAAAEVPPPALANKPALLKYVASVPCLSLLVPVIKRVTNSLFYLTFWNTKKTNFLPGPQRRAELS